MSKVLERDEKRKRDNAAIGRIIYASGEVTAAAINAGSVSVNVVIQPGALDLDLLPSVGSIGRPGSSKVDKRKGQGLTPDVVRDALTRVASEMFRRSFATEFENVIKAYRTSLHESLAKGDDPELQAALNRARLQERILAGAVMVDQAQACELLGLSTANPSATMKRKEDRRELLRFTVEGRAVYPLFQFDVENRRILPAIAQLIGMKPEAWSDFRLLHWLSRPHLDFDGAPADALRRDEAAVLSAFAREITPAVHG